MHCNPSELILVVEDDDALLKLIEKCLAANGHRTAGVSSGEEALAWLESHSPDLMLLDYSLPDMHGEQLLWRIEARGKQVAFVVATGHGSESVAVDMMKHGAYDYVVKGAAFLLLLPAVVDRALERVRQVERLAETEEELRRGPRRVGAAGRTTHGGIGRGQPSSADRDGRTQACRGSGATTSGRTGPRGQAQHRWRDGGRVGPRIEPTAQRHLQPCPGVQAAAGFRRPRLCRKSGGLAEPSERTGHAGGRNHPSPATICRQGQPLEVVVDVNAMIRDVAELMSMDARLAEAEVVFELTEPLPAVVGDRIQLEQVLVNLMATASRRCENPIASLAG